MNMIAPDLAHLPAAELAAELVDADETIAALTAAYDLADNAAAAQAQRTQRTYRGTMPASSRHHLATLAATRDDLAARTTAAQRYKHDLEMALLASTEAFRCLGCAVELPTSDNQPPAWTEHGTCRPYYGAGRRVSYDLWSSYVDRAADRTSFDRWADGMAQCGIPSRTDGTERTR